MKLSIVYEDNHLIAVEKPAGLLTQQDSTTAPSLMDHVKEYLKVTCHKPGKVFLGMVHRLDRPVSGIVLFTRTSKAASRMSRQFREGATEKFYIALTDKGAIKNQHEWVTLRHFLSRRGSLSRAHDSHVHGSKKAVLRYRLVKETRDHHLLLIHLITGKKHQIRAQLSALGVPVTGDRKYGSTTGTARDLILLHALALFVHHPTTNEMIALRSSIPGYFFENGLLHDPDLENILDRVIKEEIAYWRSQQSSSIIL